MSCFNLLKIYVPTVLSLGHFISSIQCIHFLSYVLLSGGLSISDSNNTDEDDKDDENDDNNDSANDNGNDNNDEKESNKRKIDYLIDDSGKMNLRSKKMNNLKPLFINSESEIQYFFRSDGNYDELYDKYPLCEAKYKLVDKIKGLHIFQFALNKSKKIVLLKTCIMEMYDVFFVTIRNTNDVVSIISTVYGYVPYIFMAIGFLGLLFTFNKFLIYITFLITTDFVLNDLILKKLIKMNRPINSAVPSYGMPSTHSLMSISILTFLLLHLCEGKKDKWSIMTYILAIIALLPIPWSRVNNEDHTFYQALIGSLLGVLSGFVFYFVKRNFSKCKDA
ncbi:phosphatidic acid phosphatase 2 [Plasmodium brasilianum]|uniref:PAP2-like protein, putative n=2 Tax=Plasmodium (Plasmodium) TaxID=418103 RepID=A0A1A8VMC3_PLAMA|nr:PAP2-like protein, putative [Plasmodium malariae]KAI4841281.1 phosphatidic acid phosphatase 2 [Plasmodium brasilianum]SBS81474.1 phosphatase [Plasmodium malariae]SBT86970.1 PAP2-like protein, putative [Plasmodium malariae]